MLSDEQVESIFKSVDSEDKGRFAIVRLFARAIEAEVRKEDEALIRQMLGALEGVVTQVKYYEPVTAAITAARARLLDSDLSHLTEHGKEAWKGVDPQKLRETGAL